MTALTARTSFRPPARDTFGRYRLLSELPGGGTGEVYIAQKQGAIAPCVIKTLRFELRDHETAGRRLQREAHVAAHLRHDNIAQVLDAGEQDGTFYLATELVPGQELARIVDLMSEDQRRLAPETAVRIALDVLAGLDHAHNAVGPDGEPLGIVHRDLGPRNVMIGFDGAVKIIDFGAARANVDDLRTAPGILIGTLRYMAPELATGGEADPRTDLYAAAVLLFEMLTGKLLVPLGNPFEVLSWIARQTPPLVSAVEPALGTRFDHVIARGLEKVPSDRWPTARAFREALEAATAEMVLGTREEIGTMVRTLFADDYATTVDLLRAARAHRDAVKAAMTVTLDEVPRIAIEDLVPSPVRTDPRDPPTEPLLRPPSDHER